MQAALVYYHGKYNHSTISKDKYHSSNRWNNVCWSSCIFPSWTMQQSSNLPTCIVHRTAVIINFHLNMLGTNNQKLVSLLIHHHNEHLVFGAIAVFLWISRSSSCKTLDAFSTVHNYFMYALKAVHCLTGTYSLEYTAQIWLINESYSKIAASRTTTMA